VLELRRVVLQRPDHGPERGPVPPSAR
jgi:hypothetical protein